MTATESLSITLSRSVKCVINTKKRLLALSKRVSIIIREPAFPHKTLHPLFWVFFPFVPFLLLFCSLRSSFLPSLRTLITILNRGNSKPAIKFACRRIFSNATNRVRYGGINANTTGLTFLPVELFFFISFSSSLLVLQLFGHHRVAHFSQLILFFRSRAQHYQPSGKAASKLHLIQTWDP